MLLSIWLLKDTGVLTLYFVKTLCVTANINKIPKLELIRSCARCLYTCGRRGIFNLLFKGVRWCPWVSRQFTYFVDIGRKMPKLALEAPRMLIRSRRRWEYLICCPWVSVGVTAIYVFCRYWP